jgi:hypothetical protein
MPQDALDAGKADQRVAELLIVFATARTAAELQASLRVRQRRGGFA